MINPSLSPLEPIAYSDLAARVKPGDRVSYTTVEITKWGGKVYEEMIVYQVLSKGMLCEVEDHLEYLSWVEVRGGF